MLICLPFGGYFAIGKCVWSDGKIPCLPACANDLPAPVVYQLICRLICQMICQLICRREKFIALQKF